MPGFIDLDDARRHCESESDERDAQLEAFIDAASELIATETGYVAGAGEETFVFDRFGCELDLRRRPVDPETIEVTYLDGNGETQSFTDVRIYQKHGTVRITPAIGSAWPGTACAPGAVTVTAMVGFATPEAPAPDGAPERLKQAARLMVGHWFANRETVNVGNIVSELPWAVERLLKDLRLGRV